MAVKTRTEQNGKIGIIEIKGSLVGDKDTDQFREAVADFVEQGNRALVVDMSRVNYVNSSGIGAIIAAYSSYSKNNGVIKLAGLSNNIQNLLVVTKLIDIFDVYDKVSEAVASFS
jgi:anti-sigma B factor antagonist